VDLIYEGGLSYMRYSVSDTAEYGDYTRGPVVVDDHTKQQMKKILAEVQDGSFAREWMEENAKGREGFLKMRQEDDDLLLERVGRDLRKMMAWTKKPEEASVSS
jgi:ketol-acid reductoisomerase